MEFYARWREPSLPLLVTIGVFGSFRVLTRCLGRSARRRGGGLRVFHSVGLELLPILRLKDELSDLGTRELVRLALRVRAIDLRNLHPLAHIYNSRDTYDISLGEQPRIVVVVTGAGEGHSLI